MLLTPSFMVLQVAGAGHTRLCVKGLPKHLTNERLRKHFEDVAEVTDARVCKTSDGTSRNFGFIGFRTEKDAQKCLKYFHDTFIDTSKILCEIARPKGDENLARPWSRYSEGSSAHKIIAQKSESKTETNGKSGKGKADKTKKIVSKDHELLERAKTDPKMKAFIEAFKPRTKTKVCECWCVDTCGRENGNVCVHVCVCVFMCMCKCLYTSV